MAIDIFEHHYHEVGHNIRYTSINMNQQVYMNIIVCHSIFYIYDCGLTFGFFVTNFNYIFIYLKLFYVNFDKYLPFTYYIQSLDNMLTQIFFFFF